MWWPKKPGPAHGLAARASELGTVKRRTPKRTLTVSGPGVRIPSGAPTKSNSYEEFGLRLWPNSYQLATMRQLYERDRDVSRIGVLIPPFGGLIPPAPAKISMT